MSTKPNPVASTAVMLAVRLFVYVGDYDNDDGEEQAHFVYEAGTPKGMTPDAVAALASDLHRLAPAVQRHAVAMCNGEWRTDQRRDLETWDRNTMGGRTDRVDELDADIEAYGVKLDRRIAKLNAKLAPLALQAHRSGDPRGTVLRLKSTDADRPVPCNCGDGESWAIA